MDEKALLFAMIRSVICGEQPDNISCTPEQLAQVYTLASKHSLDHLVGKAVEAWDLPPSPQAEACKQTSGLAFVRYANLDRAYTLTRKTLSAAQIPFLPLKGAVLRTLYPAPWLRTSCDVDILVPRDTVQQAADLLEEKLSYRILGHTAHDITLLSPDDTHIELHFDLVEEGRAAGANSVLGSVWQYAEPSQDMPFQYRMNDAYFYFYHIAHMAKHFEGGGCGVRPFVDLWLLDQNCPDGDARRKLLEQGGLARFAEIAGHLSRVWLAGAEHTALTAQMAHYILSGGTYGNTENYVLFHQQKSGGRGKYLLSRIFPPHVQMKRLYPCLEKRKWLTPVFYPVRWATLLFTGGGAQAVREIRHSENLNREKAEDIQKLLEEIGL